MFVVLRLQDFEFEPSPESFFQVSVKVDKGKMAGFLPVYETREDALMDFPGASVIEIRESYRLGAGTEAIEGKEHEA